LGNIEFKKRQIQAVGLPKELSTVDRLKVFIGAVAEGRGGGGRRKVAYS